MDNIFDDIYEIEDEQNLDIEIIEDSKLIVFKKWFEETINNKYKFDNLDSYIIDDNNDINFIFSQKSLNRTEHYIILPLNYILDSENIISYININYDLKDDDSLTLFIMNPIYKDNDNYKHYEITESDLLFLQNLKSKVKLNKVIFNGTFKNLDLYNKFIDIIFENFNIYPTFYYLTQIKESNINKKYYYISSFINQDKIPKETLLRDNNINIIYNLKMLFWRYYKTIKSDNY